LELLKFDISLRNLFELRQLIFQQKKRAFLFHLQEIHEIGKVFEKK